MGQPTNSELYPNDMVRRYTRSPLPTIGCLATLTHRRADLPPEYHPLHNRKPYSAHGESENRRIQADVSRWSCSDHLDLSIYISWMPHGVILSVGRFQHQIHRPKLYRPQSAQIDIDHGRENGFQGNQSGNPP